MSKDFPSNTGDLTEADLSLNFKATFSTEILPFSIHVNHEFLVTTKQKVCTTRFVDDIDQQDFTDGPPKWIVQNIAKYWSTEYDWRKVEANINNQFQQFTTLIWNETYADLVPLHFVHHKSAREDAIPLIFLHGWPGSFLEVGNLLEPLTDPPSSDLPAFHVVAPSIPGFGFSPSPKRPGLGYRGIGAVFHGLMQKLGYSKFVYQGGDAGDFIGHLMANDFPDSVVAGHSNFWIIPPSAEDVERLNNGSAKEAERSVMERLSTFANDHWSYGQIQQTRPLKLAIGLTDSPIGLAMWIYDICITVVEDRDIFTPELVVTWTMMHWINGPYAAFSLYKNGRKDGVVSMQGIGMMPYMKQPVALSQFPLDIWYRTPLDWAQRAGNVKCITEHDRGGHFAALDAPDLLVDDVRKFFGDKTLSGTFVFSDV